MDIKKSSSSFVAQERIEKALEAKNILLLGLIKNQQKEEYDASEKDAQIFRQKVRSKRSYGQDFANPVSEELHQYITHVKETLDNKHLNKKIRQLDRIKPDRKVQGSNSELNLNCQNQFEKILQKIAFLRKERLNNKGFAFEKSKIGLNQRDLDQDFRLNHSQQLGVGSFFEENSGVSSPSKGFNSRVSFDQLIRMKRENFESKRDRRKVKRTSLENVDGRIRLMKRQGASKGN